MDKKVRERRKAIHRERGRRRGSIVLAVIVVLVLIGAFFWLRASSVFAVRMIVSTKLTHVSSQTISQATSIAMGQGLLELDTGHVRDRLLSIPYIKSVDFNRKFPHTLEVKLEEYRAAANVRATDGGVWVVTIGGKVLEKRSDAALPLFATEAQLTLNAGVNLPVYLVKSLAVATILADKSTAGSIPAVAQINVSQTGEATIVLGDGSQIRLGECEKLNQKLRVASAIIEQYSRDGKHFLYIDASVPDKVAVKAK